MLSSKGRPGCENESPKYVNCVFRFVFGRTKNIDEGKCCACLGQCDTNIFFHTDGPMQVFIAKSPQTFKFNWLCCFIKLLITVHFSQEIFAFTTASFVWLSLLPKFHIFQALQILLRFQYYVSNIISSWNMWSCFGKRF